MQEAAADEPSTDAMPAPKTKGSQLPPGIPEKFAQRGWQEYLRLLTVYWKPYLEGRVTFEDAIAHLVSAV
jgi:hypothetical protein